MDVAELPSEDQERFTSRRCFIIVLLIVYPQVGTDRFMNVDLTYGAPLQ